MHHANDSPLFCPLCKQVLRGRQVFPQKQHDLVSDGLWGGPAERQLRDAGSIVGGEEEREEEGGEREKEALVTATIGSTRHTHDMDVPLHLDLRQASVCLPAILFKTPLSVPKDSVVNVQLFAPPAPQHWAVTKILMYSCACLAEHCIACMFCEICFQFCVIIFLLEKGSSEGMYSLFSLYI